MRKTFPGVPLRSFLLCWFCVALPIMAMVGISSVRGYQLGRVRYEQDAQENASSLLAYLSTRFQHAFTTGASVMSSRWYQHYLNIAALYADEFDPSFRADMIKQFSRMISTLDFVYDMMVIVPINNAVICSKGWMTFDMFEKTYGHIIRIHAEAGENIIPEISLLIDNLFSYRITDGNPRYKQGALYLLFSRGALARSIAPMLSEQFSYARLLLADTCIWEIGSPLENGVTVSVGNAYPQISLTASVPAYREVYRQGQLQGVLIEAILSIIGTCVLSLMLTKLILMPISRIIQSRIPLHGKHGPFEALNQMIDQNVQLKTQNEEIIRYFSSLQSEILFGLLTNPAVYHEDNPVREAIPWLLDGLPCLIVIGLCEANIMVCSPIYRIHVHLPDGECYALWYADEAAAYADAQSLARRFGKPCVSEVIRDPNRLQDAFASIYDTFYRENRKQYGFSLALVNELYGYQIAGKENDCLALLSRVRTQHPMAEIERLLRLFARENDVFADKLNGSWEGVEACVHSLCQSVRASHLEGSHRTAGALCEYIAKNYANPDMSIKLLCEEFTIGRTHISRLIKEHSGQTFYEYLTDLRMEKACDLLLQDDSIAAIGERIGYISYTTFKRAFLRKYGISPRIWREEHSGASR